MKTLILTLILVSSAYGQNIEATTDDGKKVILKPDKTWTFKTESQVSEQKPLTKLPVPFVGDSLVKVTEFSENLKNIEKTEFENEEEYKNRLRTLLEQTTFDNKKLNEIVFVFKPQTRYNADDQSFSFSTIFLEIEDTSLSRERKYGSYGIDLMGERSSYGFLRLYKDFEVKMLPKKAQEVKENIRLAVYGFPIEVHAYKNAGLSFIPNRFILFNNQTGEIYFDKKANNFLDK
jgi:hypothetical protein